MALKGDLAKFRRHIAKIERLSTPEAMVKLTDNLAEEAVDLIIDGMAAQHDPYGKPYAPKVFGDGRAILVGATVQLRRGNSWKRVRSDGRGFKVSCNVPYAIYHQKGTGIYGPKRRKIVPVRAKALSFEAAKLVSPKSKKWGSTRVFLRSVKGCKQRKMVPDKGLPKEWGNAFEEVCKLWFEHNFAKQP